VWNEVPIVFNKSGNLGLDIGSGDDEGDENDIGEQNNTKYM
jgi:hypothetical protein